jgi:hypothetical protein
MLGNEAASIDRMGRTEEVLWISSDELLGTLNNNVELASGSAERGAHVLTSVAFGEDKAEVSVSQRERRDYLASRDRDRQTRDSVYGRSFSLAFDSSKYARLLYREHQDADSSVDAAGTDVAAKSVCKHHLFETHSVEKAKGARA